MNRKDNIVYVLAFVLLISLAITGYVVSSSDFYQKRDAKEKTALVKSRSKKKANIKKIKRDTYKNRQIASKNRTRSRTRPVASSGRPISRTRYRYANNISYSRYQRDLLQCRMLAQQVSGYTPEQAVKGGFVGGAIGAAAGAAIGAVLGHAGKGAAIGAAAGGIGGGTYSAISAEKRYKKAYIRCMRNRGYNVLN